VLVFGIEQSATLQTDHGGGTPALGQARVPGFCTGWRIERRIVLGTGKDGNARLRRRRRAMGGKGPVRPGELQHRGGNGVAPLPQPSQIASRAVKGGEICVAVETCAVRHHVHRFRRGKGNVLLPARLAVRSP